MKFTLSLLLALTTATAALVNKKPAQVCKVNFAVVYPDETFEEITSRTLGAKGFPRTANTFKRECRKAFNLGKQK